MYIPFWPGRFIPNTLPVEFDAEEKQDAGEGTLIEMEGRESKGSAQ